MDRSHPHRLHVALALAGLAVLVATLVAAAPATLRAASGQLLSAKQQAAELAAQIADLDTGIGVAADDCAKASDDLRDIRRDIRRNRLLRDTGRVELRMARATLAQRAVALYKQDDISTLASILSADDFTAMVGRLSQVHEVVRADRAVLRTVERAQRRLDRRAARLSDEERTAGRLVRRRDRELAAIKEQLGRRQALLDSTRADIRRLVAAQAPPAPAPAPVAGTSSGGGAPDGGSSAGQDGSGPWWSLIEQAAAVNGVSARGMYRLMMIESGGDASVVGPGGYFGLFQYAPTTWKGAWNPYRARGITDGEAQIKATALALKLGYGHAWWDPSYSYAFGGV